MIFRLSILTLAASLIICAPLVSLAQDAPINRDQLEQAENHSEALANQLHALSLSVRDRDTKILSSHFSLDLVAEHWPEEAGEPVRDIRWIYERKLRMGSTRLDKAAFIDAWTTYLGHFSSIEDVRFKLKQAHFYEDPIIRTDANIYFTIVGTNDQQQREWVEAKAHITAKRKADGTWQIDHFSIKSFHARFIQANLFDEVSQSAGVYRIAPRFGSPGNQGFVAHGVAVHDVDQDGFLDVFVTGATENFLYINQGDGTFKNRSESAGVQTTPTVSAPLFLDYDNDGDSDLFMAAPGDQMLYENRMIPDGTLEFLNVSYEAGVGHLAQGFSAISADVNNDGLPDIYVASYNKYGLVMPNSWFQATNGTPNLLFINQGDGRFAEKAAAWGVADNRWSYAAQFGDLNGDGRADLYVANDFGQNAFYLNRGTHFSDAAAELGLLDPGNGMGVSFGDYDNDGLLDIHVTNMSSTAGNRILKRLFPDAMTQLDDTRVLNKLAAGNTVFKNLDNGQFKDVSATLGPFSAGWAFGGGFVDFDNDGWEDLHAPNGFISGKSLKDT